MGVVTHFDVLGRTAEAERPFFMRLNREKIPHGHKVLEDYGDSG